MPIDMNDPADKAAIEAMIEDAVTGLKTKNIDLAARLEKARKGSAIDPDEYRQVEERAAKAESDLAAQTKAAKLATTELEKIKKAHESEANFTRQLLVDNGLVDALTKAGVTEPVKLKAAKAMLTSGVTLVIDGESRTAMMGDKPLADAVKEWAGGDEGKHFVVAAQNAGGGAGGGGGKPNVDVSKLSPQQKMELGRKAA